MPQSPDSHPRTITVTHGPAVSTCLQQIWKLKHHAAAGPSSSGHRLFRLALLGALVCPDDDELAAVYMGFDSTKVYRSLIRDLVKRGFLTKAKGQLKPNWLAISEGVHRGHKEEPKKADQGSGAAGSRTG